MKGRRQDRGEMLYQILFEPITQVRVEARHVIGQVATLENVVNQKAKRRHKWFVCMLICFDLSQELAHLLHRNVLRGPSSVRAPETQVLA